MGKFKGTQGKWYLDTYADKGSVIDVCVDVNDDETTQIAQVYSTKETSYNSPQSEEHIANARLIAAAPEILEALQHTLEILYQCDPPKRLQETYANAFANYNNLIHKVTE